MAAGQRILVSPFGAPTKPDARDAAWMRLAAGLARRVVGNAWPNPAVGCLIVCRADEVVGQGWTAPGGRPHAETQALAMAGPAAAGATAYVTLEPCSHTGKTPPCADALIEAGIRRVVVGVRDPDPRVDGRGVAKLLRAGIEVAIFEEMPTEVAAVLGGFLKRVRHGRPAVTLKLATSLDGMIAPAPGRSGWVTGPLARAHAHAERAAHDAILVGIGTALVDNPELTCRLAGLEARSPVRVVVDTNARLPLHSHLVRSARDVPVWILTADADVLAARSLKAAGVKLIQVSTGRDGRVDLAGALTRLGDEGLTRVLIEGGAAIAGAVIRGALADRLLWYRSASVIGGGGVAALNPVDSAALDPMPRFERVATQRLGDDVLEEFTSRHRGSVEP